MMLESEHCLLELLAEMKKIIDMAGHAIHDGGKVRPCQYFDDLRQLAETGLKILDIPAGNGGGEG